MSTNDPLIDWLFSLQGPALKWDIDTARAFCAWLGDPQAAFPSAHVAGTNGKGSVAAMLHAITRASGLSAGLYTSPHLVRPEERIRVDDAEIAADAFRALVARLGDAARRALEAGALPRHPSFFEMMTAAGFLAFAERGVDLAVVETGLGGRLDATNVIVPRVSVITTIGLDHVKTLGGSREAIAREKAGIVKPGVPVVGGWIADRPRAVIDEAARAAGSPVHWAAQELRVRRSGPDGFDLKTPERTYRGLRCNLAGPHQLRNAALAVRAAELLAGSGLALDPGAVAEGLRSVRWPGRFERLEAPGWAGAGAAGSFRLDGAHNLDGTRALSRLLEAIDREGPRPRRVLVFGVTEGRDAARLLAPLASSIDAVLVTRPGIVKAIDPAEVVACLQAGRVALPVELVPAPDEALARAARLAGEGGEVLVAGSLYLVGDARRILLDLAGTGHPKRETHLAPAREDTAR